MSLEMTEPEIQKVRQGIKAKYDRVAAAGTGGCFQYPTGKAGMEIQGYPPEVATKFSPRGPGRLLRRGQSLQPGTP